MTARRSNPPLLPKPKRLKRRPGEFRLTEEIPIVLPPEDSESGIVLAHAAKRACEKIERRTGLSLGVQCQTSPHPSASIQCSLDPKSALSPRSKTARDSYRIKVGKRGIEIQAPTSHGLQYGLGTLAQWVSKRGHLPLAEIRDQPDYLDRGIMLDVSRGKVPHLTTLQSLVDFCVDMRLNVLMLYIEHTFDFASHPQIGAGSSPLQPETIRALDDYAFERGVELIPCLQSLGHMEHILALPRYAKLAESDRKWSVSPSRAETYAFLGDLYDDFLPLFRSKRMNANCDEPFDLGRGQSAERYPRKTPGRLFADHVGRLEKLARRHDKQLMIWADFAFQHPEEINRISRDVVLMDWWYEANFDFERVRQLRRSGFEFWVCPGTSSWNCLFPRIQNAEINVQRWAAAGLKHKATGLLNTDWGDFGHYNALGVSLQSYAVSAQQSWSGDLSQTEFDRAFARQVFDEPNARLAKLYRRLGAVHDAGFTVANGSALQYCYFDALGRSFFLQHAKARTLTSAQKKLSKIATEIKALELALAPSDFLGLAKQEVAWASDATALSVEKGLAALRYNAWRAEPDSLSAIARRRLASELDTLAAKQSDQLTRLRTLWLARSAISDFRKTRKRIRKSIASLREGANRLRENRVPRVPKPSELLMLEVFNEVRCEFGMAPR